MTYGAMSMQPIAIPAPLLIFKDIRVRGFWLTGGYAKARPPFSFLAWVFMSWWRRSGGWVGGWVFWGARLRGHLA